jgi:PAS domain S-box-containing protein
MPPGWDGIETIRQLWMVQHDLQVVICTAHSDYSWQEITDTLGATDKLLILKKPFDIVEVQQLAQTLTEKWILGRKAALVMNDLDALARKRAAALRSSEQKFARAFNSSPVPQAILSRKDHSIVSVNDRFVAMFEIAAANLLDTIADDLPISSEDGSLSELLGPVGRPNSLTSVPCSIRRATGETRRCELSTETFLDGDEPQILLIVEDVTTRVRVEAGLHRAERMDAVAQLAAGIAHDFKNILAVIQGNAAGELATATTSVSRANLTNILSATDRAALLTRQLLAFSKKSRPGNHLLNLQEIIGSTIDAHRNKIHKDTTLEIHCARALPMAEGDADDIELALNSLLSNAIEATPSGGKISVHAEKVTVTKQDCASFPERRPGDFVCIRVSDSGVGMSMEMVERIFEPFTNASSNGKKVGLSLASVYGIARQHRGWSEVASQLGGGSTFSILLPVAESTADHPKQTVEIEKPDTRPQTVLVVSEERPLRELLSMILQSEGFAVYLAADSTQAREIVHKNGAEITTMVSDTYLTGNIDARALGAEFRGSNPGLSLVFMEPYGTKANCDDNTLQKPFPPESLINLLKRRPAANG